MSSHVSSRLICVVFFFVLAIGIEANSTTTEASFRKRLLGSQTLTGNKTKASRQEDFGGGGGDGGDDGEDEPGPLGKLIRRVVAGTPGFISGITEAVSDFNGNLNKKTGQNSIPHLFANQSHSFTNSILTAKPRGRTTRKPTRNPFGGLGPASGGGGGGSGGSTAFPNFLEFDPQRGAFPDFNFEGDWSHPTAAPPNSLATGSASVGAGVAPSTISESNNGDAALDNFGGWSYPSQTNYFQNQNAQLGSGGFGNQLSSQGNNGFRNPSYPASSGSSPPRPPIYNGGNFNPANSAVSNQASYPSISHSPPANPVAHNSNGPSDFNPVGNKVPPASKPVEVPEPLLLTHNVVGYPKPDDDDFSDYEPLEKENNWQNVGPLAPIGSGGGVPQRPTANKPQQRPIEAHIAKPPKPIRRRPEYQYASKPVSREPEPSVSSGTDSADNKAPPTKFQLDLINSISEILKGNPKFS